MSAPVVLRLDGDAVGTAELGVLDEVGRALEQRQGGPTALTAFLEQLFQVCMNRDVLELVVEKS